MLSACSSVQWETSLPEPAPICGQKQSSPFGGSTWCHGRVLLACAWITRCYKRLPSAGKSWVEEEEDKGLGWVRCQGWCEQT